MKTTRSTKTTIVGAAMMALATLLAASDHGANVRSNEQLVLAAERGYLDDVKRLLNEGISVNGKDHRELTPWQAARIYGRKGVADFLASNLVMGQTRGWNFHLVHACG